MHNIGFDKERDFRPRLIDRAGAWLSRRTYIQASALVVAATFAVCVLDYNTTQFELCIATLYVIPISIACWYFGNMEGLAVTIAVTVLAFMKYPLLNSHPAMWIGIYNGAARVVAFCFNAMVVLGARRIYAQMHYLAHRDRMTGVLNKAAFENEIDAQLLQARAGGNSLLLTFIDIDGFKRVNDQFGHDAGDKVLRVFTEAAEKELRATDRIGQLGGDEFATLSVIGRDEDAHALVETLHRRFSAILGRSGHAVTCSMGAVIVPAGLAIGRDDLLQEADRLMYGAKRSGKNVARISNATLSIVKVAPPVQSVSRGRSDAVWATR